MPASFPRIGIKLKKILQDLGARLRARRKKLGISAITTAEAAGMSRITLNRIERGEPSVAMGAYMSVIFALGLEVDFLDPQKRKRRVRSLAEELPKKIRLGDYPQLKQLSWQLKGTQEISPKDALEIYERNWRHVDLKKMDEREQQFLENLLEAFGRERLLV